MATRSTAARDALGDFAPKLVELTDRTLFDDVWARPQLGLLLAHGADPNARASLRKRLHPGYGPDTLHEVRDVTPVSWGERFHRPIFVNEAALRLLREAGGKA